MGLATSRQEAFWEACGFGHIAKAKYLLEAGDIDINWVSYTNDCCPIHTASQGKKEIVDLLIQHRCDVNVKDIRGNLPLHHAAMKGHADIIEMLLNAGSEIDVQEKNGWTALHNAAYWCHPEVVRRLIKRGCNVHLQNKDERTALHECARSQVTDDKKLAEIALMLTEAGSDINAKSSDFGEADLTGLMFAAYHNHPEVAAVLIDAGCELDAIGTTFWTALHWAADRENDEVVYILLDAGANPVKRCLKGDTAYDRAKSESVKEILATAMQLHKELHRVSITEKLPLVNRAKTESPYKPMCDPNFKSQSFLPTSWKPSSSENVKNLINEKKAQLAETTKGQNSKELANETGTTAIIHDVNKSEEKQNNSDTDKPLNEDARAVSVVEVKQPNENERLESGGKGSRYDHNGELKNEEGFKENSIKECKIEAQRDIDQTVAAQKEESKEKDISPEKAKSTLPCIWNLSPSVNVKTLISEKKTRLAAMTSQQYRNELAKRTGSSTVITDADTVNDCAESDPKNMDEPEKKVPNEGAGLRHQDDTTDISEKSLEDSDRISESGVVKGNEEDEKKEVCDVKDKESEGENVTVSELDISVINRQQDKNVGNNSIPEKLDSNVGSNDEIKTFVESVSSENTETDILSNECIQNSVADGYVVDVVSDSSEKHSLSDRSELNKEDLLANCSEYSDG